MTSCRGARYIGAYRSWFCPPVSRRWRRVASPWFRILLQSTMSDVLPGLRPSMQFGKPSRTAYAAATHRAAHQVLDAGRIFADPLALSILGADAADIARDAEASPASRAMRLFIAARTRFAEDALAVALGGGVRQIVVLGAGLDTYAYRSVLPEGVRIFEVDHPATQAWKRECLAAAKIEPPQSLTFAPIDFERQRLVDGLVAAGFDAGRQTFFTWLGVVPYLTESAVWSTLGYIASVSEAHVVFDYSDPPHTLSAPMRSAHEARAARVAAMGEAWLSIFCSGRLGGRIAAAG